MFGLDDRIAAFADGGSIWIVLAVAVLLGLRHATDPDHVIAVSTIISRERSIVKAGLIGVMWGIGHTLTLVVIGTAVQAIERCSGHDGTYGVKKEYAAVSRKIARPVARQVDNAEAQHFTSDCPMAAEQIAAVAESGAEPTHPIQLLRKAYGI